ncbi:flavin reductase family protein [Krasilnikovia sp. MM14-A1259]|uniref:flavin reductase family protein n=1 Tax=Krasilnikovia sp. MM14-A1259 TaxID=3373539 RepID=UPI0037FB0118
MTMRPAAINKAHRLLAPRVAFLIGTRDAAEQANLIPISNVTSVSTDPQQILVAVHRAWKTYDNLNRADGFTVSVPADDQLDGVWKLGARYSRHLFPDRATKLRECGMPLIDTPHGPVLANGLGWMSCLVIQRPDFGGDHGVFVGEVADVHFNDTAFTDEAEPRGELRPVMQVTGNLFSTTGPSRRIPYGDEDPAL